MLELVDNNPVLDWRLRCPAGLWSLGDIVHQGVYLQSVGLVVRPLLVQNQVIIISPIILAITHLAGRLHLKTAQILRAIDLLTVPFFIRSIFQVL